MVAPTRYTRWAITRIASLCGGLATSRFVNGTHTPPLATLDRVANVATYSQRDLSNNGFAALRSVAGAIVGGIGTKVFWVTTGGYDTHATQNTTNGAYANLMTTLDGGLAAFYADLRNQGLLGETLILQFSEFGRRISENGSQGTDHGAGGLMMAIGGAAWRTYGTAADLAPGGAIHARKQQRRCAVETDFRSVYASVLDNGSAPTRCDTGGDYPAVTSSFESDVRSLQTWSDRCFGGGPVGGTARRARRGGREG